MTSSSTASKISGLWRIAPAVTAGGTWTGVSAALWSFKPELDHDMVGEVYPDHIISLPVAGRHRSTYFADGRQRYSKSIEPWSVNIFPAGEQPRAILQVDHVAVRYLHFYLPPSLIEKSLSELDDLAVRTVELIDPRSTRDPVIKSFGREVLNEIKEGSRFSRLKLDVLGLRLVIHLLSHYSNVSGNIDRTSSQLRGGLAPWQVKRVSDYLEDRLAEDVTLAELGGLLDLSTFRLCRAFKQSTGLPPHRWRHQRRIERARELLEGTDLPVTEVAAQVGYDDPSQLAAAFRKALGLSPSQYRRERRS